ncbi:hypothetical protein A7Q09_03670 [Methylacidiphilum sp. Yel]|nr:hypothetical protein A7Q09_03670 [Methylacidiphilum sp. Yel]
MGDKNEIRRFFEIYNYLTRKDIKKMCNLDHFYYQELLKEKEQLVLPSIAVMPLPSGMGI